MLAVDLIVWTQHLLLSGDLAKAEPKTLRYRLLHVAARLTRGQRRLWLRIQRTWPWAPTSPRPLPDSRRYPFRPVDRRSRHDERRELPAEPACRSHHHVHPQKRHPRRADPLARPRFAALMNDQG